MKVIDVAIGLHRKMGNHLSEEEDRRLSRYDEAIALLRRAEPFTTLGLSEVIMAFLASEPDNEGREG